MGKIIEFKFDNKPSKMNIGVITKIIDIKTGKQIYDNDIIKPMPKKDESNTDK